MEEQIDGFVSSQDETFKLRKSAESPSKAKTCNVLAHAFNRRYDIQHNNTRHNNTGGNKIHDNYTREK